MTGKNPNPKSQIPKKSQFPNSQMDSSVSQLSFQESLGAWDLELVWNLGFGIWNFDR